MSLLNALGFFISKPKVEIPKTSIDNSPTNTKQSEITLKHLSKVTEDYYAWIPKDVFVDICSLYDYTNIVWGSRKMGRLTNICRNILDIEIIKETPTFTEDERYPVLRLLYFSCCLYQIVVTKYLLIGNVFNEYKPVFTGLLSRLNCDNDEINTVLSLVFNGSEDESSRLSTIFHDALRFEEYYFTKKPFPSSLMKTTLGKNNVFAIPTHRNSANNTSPSWLFLLQNKYKVNNFIDVKRAKASNALAQGSQL